MPEPRLSVSTRARFEGESLAGFLERALDSGFGSVFLETLGSGEQQGVLPFREALQAGPAVLAGLRIGQPLRGDASLVSGSSSERIRATQQAAALARLGEAMGSKILVLRPGTPAQGAGHALDMPRLPEEPRPEGTAPKAPPALHSSDLVLDRLCRSIYDLSTACPEQVFCLAPGEAAGELPLPGDFELIVSELGRKAPMYWHDTGDAALRAHLGGFSPDSWLHGAGDRIAGITLSDTDGTSTGLPPGSGLVSFEGLGAALPGRIPVVISMSAEFTEPGFPAAIDIASQLLRG